MTDPYLKQKGIPKPYMMISFILFISSFVKRLNKMV